MLTYKLNADGSLTHIATGKIIAVKEFTLRDHARGKNNVAVVTPSDGSPVLQLGRKHIDESVRMFGPGAINTKQIVEKMRSSRNGKQQQHSTAQHSILNIQRARRQQRTMPQFS